LAGFEAAFAAGRAAATTPPHITVTPQAARDVAMNALEVRLPNGTPLVDVDGLHFPAGQNVLVNGPSGSGKSTLFRAIAGVWPFGTGPHLRAAGRARDAAAAAALSAGRRPAWLHACGVATRSGQPAKVCSCLRTYYQGRPDTMTIG
jgi:energy-coupling factor transporter ATP-binding protein EcfA2